MEVVVASGDDLARWIADGTFDHALNVAPLYLAAARGRVPLWRCGAKT
jgi:hypothetical protein